MFGRFVVYLLAATLSLSAMAVGLVEVLFRWKVKPSLETNRVKQEKVYQPYLEDLHFLERFTLLHSDKVGKSDAGIFLNSKVYWSPGIPSEAKSHGTAKPIVPLEARQELIRLRGDWMRKYPRVKNVKADLSFFTGLGRFDHWDIERGSPIEDLASRQEFVPPAQLPVPEAADLLAAVKIRLMRGALTEDPIGALSDVRELSRLMISTENSQLLIAGLAALDHERFAYRYFVDEKKIEANSWLPIDRNSTRRAHRAALASRAFLHLWTRADKIERIYLGAKPPVAFCAAANEAFPMIFSVRTLLAPRWPFEMSLRNEYNRVDAIFKRAQSACRLRYLTTLAGASLPSSAVSYDAFQVRIPGPLLLNRLPYSRKVFGLRISVDNFSGFDDYKIVSSAL